MDKLIIHIHGFLSANDAERVKSLRQHITNHDLPIEVISPQLPNTPKAAIELLETIIAEEQNKGKNIALIGHSMGGYFATYLAAKFNLNAALINPVVRGYEIMCEFFGDCYNPLTDEYFSIAEEDIGFLTTINLEHIPNPTQLLVMQQLGDEITDPNDAIAHYQPCQLIVEPGGCHDFDNFEQHLDKVLQFLFP